MSDSKSSSSGGISVVGALGIAFVVLKLCGVIAWSWWWVTLPFWGFLAVIVIILLGIGLFALAAFLVTRLAEIPDFIRRIRGKDAPRLSHEHIQRIFEDVASRHPEIEVKDVTPKK